MTLWVQCIYRVVMRYDITFSDAFILLKCTVQNTRIKDAKLFRFVCAASCFWCVSCKVFIKALNVTLLCFAILCRASTKTSSINKLVTWPSSLRLCRWRAHFLLKSGLGSISSFALYKSSNQSAMTNLTWCQVSGYQSKCWATAGLLCKNFNRTIYEYFCQLALVALSDLIVDNRGYLR